VGVRGIGWVGERVREGIGLGGEKAVEGGELGGKGWKRGQKVGVVGLPINLVRRWGIVKDTE